MNPKFILATLVSVLLPVSVLPGAAQEYPSRPVRMVVPFAAGGGTDLVGRIVANELSKGLNQQFYIENRAGAAGQAGTDLVAKSNSDGYTLLWTVTDGLSVLPAVKVSMPYKIPDDFAFIAGVLQLPFAVAVNAKVPLKSMAELIAYARANPGKLNFGSAGIGSAPHMGIALISAAAGIEMVHVPFAGLGPATNALVAGTVDVGLVTPPRQAAADSGAIRVIAVTGNKRYAAIPEVPTLKEAGLNVSTIVGYGLSAPAGTPETVLARLKQGIVRHDEGQGLDRAAERTRLRDRSSTGRCLPRLHPEGSRAVAAGWQGRKHQDRQIKSAIDRNAIERNGADGVSAFDRCLKAKTWEFVLIRSIFALLLGLVTTATAQEAWPSRSITIICPYAAGTTPDIIARQFGDALSKRLGQPVIVESKLGAGGLLGTEYAAAQKPDGYTLLLGSKDTNAVLGHLYTKRNFDPNKALVPISLSGHDR